MPDSFPDQSLVKLGDNLWQVTGSLPRSPLPRNMIIHRLHDGGLLFHSVIAMADTMMARLESLGQPRVMIIPNTFHTVDARWYLSRYPEMKVLCPSFCQEKLSKVIPIHGICEDFLEKVGIACIRPEGTRPFELVYEIGLKEGKALVMTDLLFNVEHLPGISGLILRVIGSSGFFGMTRVGKLFLLIDKELFRQWLLGLSQTPNLRVISMAHGSPILKNCSTRLTEVAERL